MTQAQAMNHDGTGVWLTVGYVRVSTVVTGNGHRDKDLNKALQSDVYPTMRFDLTGVTPGAERGDMLGVVLQGRFTIHGVTREASIPATLLTRPDAIRVAGIRRSA